MIGCGELWAQGSTAQINGAIRDASGLAVPGAEVKATLTSTGVARTVTSGADGAYILPALPVGPYMLEVAKEGFTKYIQSGIILQVDSNPTIDVALKIGSVNEQVTVQADANLVETHSTGIGTVVDQQRVTEMPLNGRQLTQLIFLAGGATNSGQTALNSNRNYPTVVIAVAGGLSSGVTFTLDGGSHNDPFNNQNLPLPFPDALQEFKVETGALSAQYGHHSQAAVNGVTKSGSNEFHGAAFEFLRNGDFNARDFFATRRDSLKRNQFGGTIGGPVMKNKLFFFAGYQGTLQRSDPVQTFSFVPTPAMLKGDFTAITSPACNNGRQINLPAAQGFTGNQIAPSLFSPQAVKLAGFLPTVADPCGKDFYGPKNDSDEHLGLVRVDYQVNSKHSVFGRYILSRLEQPASYDGKDPNSITTAIAYDRIQSFVLGDTYLLGAATVNSFRATINRARIDKTQVPFFSPPDFGTPLSTPMPSPYTYLNVAGGFQLGPASALPGNWDTTTPQIGDDVSLVRGAHQIGFGVNWERPQLNTNGYLYANGYPNFTGQVTGLGLADFLLGKPTTFQQGANTTGFDYQRYLALYVQDAWRITPRLTINAGLRWEPYFALGTKHGQTLHFDQAAYAANQHSSVYVNAPAGLTFPGDAGFSGNNVSNNKMTDFAPRLGMVWDPTGQGKMTVRAAYGIFYDLPNLYYYYGITAQPPWGTTISVTNPPGGLANPWQGFPGGNPFPIKLAPNMTFATAGSYFNAPMTPQPTYLNQWTLSLQRQVGTNWLFSANYIGNNVIHMWAVQEGNPAVFLGLGACTINGVSYSTCSTTANTNQRRQLTLQNPAQGPYYATVATADEGGTGTYDGMLLSVQRRLDHGVTIQGNYTWSHCISDAIVYQPNAGGTAATPGNRRADRGNCATTDRRQIMNISAVAETPSFGNKTLRLLASGWRISALISAQSGPFITILSGIDNSLTGVASQRASLLVADPYVANKGVNGWLNPQAFASPAAGTFGNLAPSNIVGPASLQIDMGLSRLFHVREKQTLELRAEAFNLPNLVNLSTPTATLTSGTFGKITSDVSGSAASGQIGDPRLIQLALKFAF